MCFQCFLFFFGSSVLLFSIFKINLISLKPPGVILFVVGKLCLKDWKCFRYGTYTHTLLYSQPHKHLGMFLTSYCHKIILKDQSCFTFQQMIKMWIFFPSDTMDFYEY